MVFFPFKISWFEKFDVFFNKFLNNIIIIKNKKLSSNLYF
jgi:hypothetical protein